MRLRCVLPLAAALALALPAAAGAADVPPGAVWTEATIPSDGAQLHADILRPKNLPKDAKTPVILSIGPYFNHSGQTGPAGPAEGTSFDPVGPSTGPSDRFFDFVQGAHLMERGYTFVMADLRGFGGSSGCLDWGGPGEQADVVSAVKWAATQPWSTGSVGMYGKSYDAVTGLVGVDKQPAGLKAVVAQEPVYDLYRYLYGDGLRRLNSTATPALYDAIAATPGPLADISTYNANAVNDPACLSLNLAQQAGNDDHSSAFWKARNLIPGAKGSDVPLLLTQGLTENNTVSDGTQQYLQNHTGYERAWLGPWEHVRGNETVDGTPSGRLKMGRKGWFDEVMRFYDQFLRGDTPSVQDPPVAVQTNDGKWRAEESWPPVDSVGYTSALKPGTYNDGGNSATTGAGAEIGSWTISPALPYDAHLAGSGRVTLDLTSTVPNANVIVDVYDLDKNGTGPLITRQGYLLRQNGRITLDLWSADWRIAAGHRIGVKVCDSNDWWIQPPSNGDVTIKSGTISLPFLTFRRTATIQGDPGVQLSSVLNKKVTVPAATLKSATAGDFTLPPALQDPPVIANAAPNTPQVSASSPVVQAAVKAAKARLTAKLRALKHGRVVVTGRAPNGTRLTVKLRRGKHTVATKRVKARRGVYRATFRVRPGRYTAVVSGKAGGKRLRATARAVRIRR